MANNSNRDPQISPADTKRIMETILHPDMKDNPLAFVLYAFPWGRANTPLANRSGPNKWQREELIKIANHIAENKKRISEGKNPLVYKCAIASGRGVGKSTFVAWITLWFMSCVTGGSTIISANTDSQLTSKTFGEIGKWLTMAINGYWFDRTQKKITPKEWFAAQLRNILRIDEGKYYAEGVLWNDDNPDAFAGEHSSVGCLLIFDEASGIPEPIWNVSDGFFTDLTLYRFWFTFSNPRKNTGPFFDCFHKHRSFWHTRQIDARTVEGLDKATYDEIISKNGEDSDVARVEVKGQFPSQGDHQFISRGIVLDAQDRQLDRYDDYAALVMGVDPARYGDDSTVIRFRRGRDARSIPHVELKGADNMKVANICADLIDRHQPDGVFIDSGAGAGIIDRLKERGYRVFEVGFGTESKEPQYSDHRTEIWARMRDWLPGAMIDNSAFLLDDLVGPEYEFVGREDKIKLESKEKMKKRGLASPNHADALAVTFHLTIARYDNKLSPNHQRRANRVAKGVDYKIFGGK
jgi:hypothetical protein